MTRARTRRSKAWYNALSRYYDVCIDPFQGRLRRRGIEYLRPSPGDHVLDVGCGTGRGVARFGPAVGSEGHVVGIDVAEQMCRLTRERLHDAAPSTVVCGDALAMPFATDSFDVVLASFTLELFEEDLRNVVLSELRRVLEPEGRICVISPTSAASTIVAPLYARLNDVLPTLVDRRPIDVGGVLTEVGFEVVRIRFERVFIVPVELVVARSGSGI